MKDDVRNKSNYSQELDYLVVCMLDGILESGGPATLLEQSASVMDTYINHPNATPRQKELWTFLSSRFRDLASVVQRTLEEFAHEGSEHEEV